MNSAKSDIDQIQSAAAHLVAAFGRHDTRAYFACFAPDATFVFHAHDTILNSRADYESLWASWERDLGFKVISCLSHDPQVQVCQGVGILRHIVTTHIHTNDSEQVVQERETIVFAQNSQGEWLGVHEHLSLLGDASEAQASEAPA